MDRARRAEPFSNATIWTREIARNLAGHLDRLSKVHSCVDSSSPKTSHAKHATLLLKRAGQVSPLRLDHSAPTGSRAQKNGNEERDDHLLGLDTNQRDCATSRDEVLEKAGTPVRRRKLKALKKIKAVSRRVQGKIERHEIHTHENQRLPDHLPDDGAVGTDYPEYSESLHHVPHVKKGPPQDYHKRQEQHRIWQENQALVKRLRNTKPTLSSKVWEKDDKWNQDFLRKQEKRRQALHNEMARTLASPHSALIRVKHVTHPASQPIGDQVLDEMAGGAAVTAIEVTTHHPIASGMKDLRRRRSVGEDPRSGSESRQHSTAPNHRRIMELRKQKDRDPNAATTDTGPPDELVSVRFTFSREGGRGLCTPNGIRGQFSPAVELEAALEASFDKDVRFEAVPDLEPPHSSRLDESESETTYVGSDVFEALQSCIDAVVASAVPEISLDDPERGEHWETLADVAVSDGETERVAGEIDECTIPDGSDEIKHESRDCVVPLESDPAGHEEVDNSTLQNQRQESGDESTEIASHSLPDEDEVLQVPDERSTQNQREEKPQRESLLEDPRAEVSVSETGSSEQDDSEPIAPSVSPLLVEETDDESPETAIPVAELDVDASAYGSEFDAEETAREAAATPPAEQPALPEQLEDDDEYEDDHTAEDPPPDDTATSPPPTGHDEPHYDDDLEPEHDAHEPEEQSYADDAFD